MDIAGDDRRSLERLALRALCQAPRGSPVREAARAALENHLWSDVAAEAVFKALMSVPQGRDDPETIRRELPARVTRLGFPDFEFDELFVPHNLADGQLLEIFERLRAPGKKT